MWLSTEKRTAPQRQPPVMVMCSSQAPYQSFHERFHTLDRSGMEARIKSGHDEHWIEGRANPSVPTIEP